MSPILDPTRILYSLSIRAALSKAFGTRAGAAEKDDEEKDDEEKDETGKADKEPKEEL